MIDDDVTNVQRKRGRGHVIYFVSHCDVHDSGGRWGQQRGKSFVAFSLFPFDWKINTTDQRPSSGPDMQITCKWPGYKHRQLMKYHRGKWFSFFFEKKLPEMIFQKKNGRHCLAAFLMDSSADGKAAPLMTWLIEFSFQKLSLQGTVSVGKISRLMTDPLAPAHLICILASWRALFSIHLNIQIIQSVVFLDKFFRLVDRWPAILHHLDKVPPGGLAV